jgi:hypothetical protein
LDLTGRITLLAGCSWYPSRNKTLKLNGVRQADSYVPTCINCISTLS